MRQCSIARRTLGLVCSAGAKGNSANDWRAYRVSLDSTVVSVCWWLKKMYTIPSTRQETANGMGVIDC